jgi:hypothetical protein
MSDGSLLALAVAIPVIVTIVWWFGIMIATLARGPGSMCLRCGSKRTLLCMPRAIDIFFPAFVLPRWCEFCEGRFYSLQSVSYVGRARASRALIPSTAQSSSRR